MSILRERIDAFVLEADRLSAEYFKANGYTFSLPPLHRANFSEKWAKVVVLEDRGAGSRVATSVYAFIALKDNVTRTLGVVKAGDIHKAASFSAPAKVSRGSVFSADFDNALTPNGIVYR